MATTAIVINKQNDAADTIEDFYTSPPQGAGTVITAFTASNDTTSSKSYLAYIFDSTGTLVSSVIPMTIVVRDRASPGSTIINQTIPAGGSLRVESSAANSLSFYASGVEQ